MAYEEPTQDIRWASEDTSNPYPNVQEPPEGTKDFGFDYQEPPPRNWINWWMRYVRNFIEWIRQEIKEPGVYGESGLGTAAGKTIGSGKGEVPIYNDNKFVDIDIINGSHSHLSDTGPGISTNHLRQIQVSESCQASGSKSQVNASLTNSHASGEASQVNASGGSTASGFKSQVNASNTSEASAERSQVNSSTAGVASGNRSQVNASNSGQATGEESQVNCSDIAQASGDNSQINASVGTSTTAGNVTQINASNGGTIGANASEASISASDACDISPASAKSNLQINASKNGCTAKGNCSQVNGCDDCDAEGDHTQINASDGASSAAGTKNQINASGASTINANASEAEISASNTCQIDPSTGKSNMTISASSGSCKVRGNNSQINASTGACQVSEAASNAQVNASDDCDCQAAKTQVNASENGSQANAQSSQINCSNNCHTAGPGSQINASIDCNTVAAGSPAQVNASSASCSAEGPRTQINACEGTIVDGNTSQANASSQCNVDGNETVVSACFRSDIDADRTCAIALSSDRVKPGINYSVCGGYNGSGDPLTANRKWELDSQNGNIYGSGTVAGSHTFPDYAEMFENLDPGEIPVGTIVALKGRKVKPAETGDRILGVVSGNPQFLGGDSMFTWSKRYLMDDFGRPVYEKIPDPSHKGKGKAPLIMVLKENPDFDPERENIPRRQRPAEWTCVAMMGQILTRLGPDVRENDYVEANGNKSDTPSRLECMEITKPYNKKTGFAIGLCLIR